MAATEGPWTPGRLLAAALALPLAAPVYAESPPERATLSLKVLDYLDSQPGSDRVRVRAPSLQLTLPVAGRWAVGASVISDAISGASPAYHSSALGRFSDERNAGDLAVTHYFDDSTLTLGAAYSKESDYISRGLTLQGSTASDDRNTTWNAGLAFNRDHIDPVNRIVRGERKQVRDLVIGVTQVLGRHDVAQITLGHAQQQGYLSDPYKALDQRPRTRDATRLLLRWNHHLEPIGATLRWQYRAWHDSWGLSAHTLGLDFVQALPAGFTVTPSLRLYTQSAARFYVDADPDAGPFVPQPPPGAVYSTLDQRLSAFGARTLGLKLSRQFGPDWVVDIKFERYAQRASWRLGGSGSPGLAEFDARSWQLGLSHSF